MSEGSFISRHWKKITAGAAGLAGLIGVEAGIHQNKDRSAEAARTAPASVESKKDAKVTTSFEDIKRQTQMEKDAESVNKVRMLIRDMGQEERTDGAAKQKISTFLKDNLPGYKVDEPPAENFKFFFVSSPADVNGSFATIQIRILADGNYRLDPVTGWDAAIDVPEVELKDKIEKKIQISQMVTDAHNAIKGDESEAVKEQIFKTIEAFAKDNNMAK